MNNQAEKYGERAVTRARLVAVFNALLLQRQSGRPKVAEIIAEAGVARSTFYDHFDGVEALLNESLGTLLGEIAKCLVGQEDLDRLEWLTAHIDENRLLARELLTGPRGERAEAELARAVSQRLDWEGDKRLAGILVGGTVIAALGAWVAGRLTANPTEMASAIYRSSNAILAQRP